ncbi:hypothetical protein AURDEDRAFT_162106 [Auricularia subglabra TFB-10046 SS5]|nr:hypothetical protein AURDEDRAFT_162106 [Auricularia subglabra TFB-10046 SS5]
MPGRLLSCLPACEWMCDPNRQIGTPGVAEAPGLTTVANNTIMSADALSLAQPLLGLLSVSGDGKTLA